jgi:hypothetical protein
MTRLLTMLGVSGILASAAVAANQPSADVDRRAAITVMRAINTAEHAIHSRNGAFVHLTELLEHPAMGRVKPNLAINGGVVTHQGATIRLALSSDGKQYQVSVVPGETCGWAAFSDERGLIYTGKVLDCK